MQRGLAAKGGATQARAKRPPPMGSRRGRAKQVGLPELRESSMRAACEGGLSINTRLRERTQREGVVLTRVIANPCRRQMYQPSAQSVHWM